MKQHAVASGDGAEASSKLLNAFAVDLTAASNTEDQG